MAVLQQKGGEQFVAPYVHDLCTELRWRSRQLGAALQLISQGLADKEISNAIFISQFTVKDLVKCIGGKTGAVSRDEIIALLPKKFHPPPRYPKGFLGVLCASFVPFA